MGCPAPVQALYSVLLKVKGKRHRCWLTVTQLSGSEPALVITAASKVATCSCILLHFTALLCLLLYSRARVRRSTAAVSPLQRLHSLYFLHSTFFQVTAVTVIVS